MKMLWSKPQMTEIKIEMTAGGWNKIGVKADGGKYEGQDTCGDPTWCADCS